MTNFNLDVALNSKQKQFVKNNMQISIDHLNENAACRNSSQVASLISLYVSKLIDALMLSKSEDCLKDIYIEYSQKTALNAEVEYLESIWHAFHVFRKGGLYDLYRFQQNEGWYPKIALTKELQPNDISTLDNKITIFRGCDISEFEKSQYGQSWSTDVNVAKEFAFKHYASQGWFNHSNRVVLQASIKKENIYYSNQSMAEKEIAIDTTKLSNVSTLNLLAP